MGGLPLEVASTGTGGTQVIFVHGALGSGGSFGRVAALLDREARMSWYDRRGYGRSQSNDPPVPITVHMADLVQVLDSGTSWSTTPASFEIGWSPR